MTQNRSIGSKWCKTHIVFVVVVVMVAVLVLMVEVVAVSLSSEIEWKKRKTTTKCFTVLLGSGVSKYQKLGDRWKALEIIFNSRPSRTL